MEIQLLLKYKTNECKERHFSLQTKNGVPLYKIKKEFSCFKIQINTVICISTYLHK